MVRDCSITVSRVITIISIERIKSVRIAALIFVASECNISFLSDNSIAAGLAT
jgi:hypothetical protein